MPDIALRFHKDMLVLSSPIAPVLARQGFDVDEQLEMAGLVEEEAVRDALRLNKIAGAQCLVANTAGVTPAHLARVSMEDHAQGIVDSALKVVAELKPQHVLVEIAPCGLPLDPSSKQSLNENRDQYARAARALAGKHFDAVFLNGFTRLSDLKCALMGVSQVLDAPVIASVDVLADGTLASGRATIEEAVAEMAEFGASVAGFSTKAGIEDAERLCRTACAASMLPVLVQLDVVCHDEKQGRATQENPYFCPDVAVQVAVRLRAAGAQFLRAAGNATPAYTGALIAATEGFDVVRPDIEL